MTQYREAFQPISLKEKKFCLPFIKMSRNPSERGGGRARGRVDQFLPFHPRGVGGGRGDDRGRAGGRGRGGGGGQLDMEVFR